MTLSEYFETPEALIPEELIYGAVRVAEAPSVSHQRVVLKLALALNDHVEETRTGELFIAPIDVIFDRARALVLQPDLLFVSSSRRDIVADRVYGAPDLVIEVLSPHPRIGSLDERVRWFAEYGVPEVWLYHQPDRTMAILHCADGAVKDRTTYGFDEAVVSAVLPQFRRTMRSVLELRTE